MAEWRTIGESFKPSLVCPRRTDDIKDERNDLGMVEFTQRKTKSNSPRGLIAHDRTCVYGRRRPRVVTHDSKKSFCTLPPNISVNRNRPEKKQREPSTRNLNDHVPSTTRTPTCVSSNNLSPACLRDFSSDRIRPPSVTDGESSSTLWHLDTQYVYHVLLLENPPRHTPSTNRHTNRRFWSRKRHLRSEVLGEQEKEATVNTSLLANTRKRCLENPTCTSLWVSLSRLETSAHTTGLTQRDRFNRRLAVLKEGMEFCNYHITLLLEFLRILELRDSSRQVTLYYLALLDLSTLEKYPEEDWSEDVVEVIQNVKSFKIKPSILHQFLQFYNHSSQFSSSGALRHIVKLLPTLALRKPKCIVKFDQTAETIAQEKQEALRENGRIGSQFVFYILRLLISSSQWVIVSAFIQVLGHLNMLRTVHGYLQCTSSLDLEIQRFWQVNTPRLGSPAATSLYLSLVQTGTSEVSSAIVGASKNVPCTKYDQLNALLDDVVDSIHLPDYETQAYINESDSSFWFDVETYLDQLHWVMNQEKPVMLFNSVSPPLESDNTYLPLDESKHFHFLVDAVSDVPASDLRWSLLDTLGHPFMVLRKGSLFSAYRESLCDTQLDLLIHLQEGVRYRDSQTHGARVPTTSIPVLDLFQGGSPLPLSEAFGFTLGGSYLCDLGFFIQHVRRLGNILHTPPSSTIEDLYDDVSIRQRFVHRGLGVAYTSSVLVAQMLSWCLDDPLLHSALIGFLCYVGKEQMAKKVLMLSDTVTYGWVYFVLFHFLRQPSRKRQNETRGICVRVVKALRMLPRDLSFLCVMLRIECLGLREQQRDHVRTSHLDYPEAHVCPPSVLQLLCCVVEDDLDLWLRTFHFDANHLDTLQPWRTQTFPSRVRLLAAHRWYEASLKKHISELNGVPSASSCIPSILPWSGFVAALASFLLSAITENQCVAWENFQSCFADMEHAWESTAAHKVSFFDTFSGDIEAIMDIVLLCIMTCTAKLETSFSLWNQFVIEKILTYVLKHFPDHNRASWLTTQIFRTRCHLLKLRCFLLPSLVSVKSLVISELCTGYPCYRRIDQAFHVALTMTESKHNEKAWDLYIHVLYVVYEFGTTFFTGLPQDSFDDIRKFIKARLSDVSQEACFSCPYSKKLALHRLYILRLMISHNDADPERFLEDVELLYTRDVHCMLDPLSVIATLTNT